MTGGGADETSGSVRGADWEDAEQVTHLAADFGVAAVNTG